MYFTQVGQIGTPVIVAKKAQLPTPNATNVGRYYITTYDPVDSSDYPEGTVLTVKQDGDTFSLVAVFQMPVMTNPIESSADIVKGKQAVNNNGQLVTGTFTTAEKTIEVNGIYYPADDNVNAYNKVTVNIAGETAENPYIATTDTEMEAYLAEEYKDSFVRMDYAKYRVTLPANATYDQAKFNYESIGISRMCAYIDKWLGSDSSKNVLTLSIPGFTNGSTGAELTAHLRTTAYRFSNADGTYGYALSFRLSYADNAGNETKQDMTPMFLYHIKSGTVIDDWTADNDYNDGWTYFGGDTNESTMETVNNIIQLLYIGRTGSYTVAISDALVLTNMAGSEVDNKYVEGAVYKVVAKYNEINTYVAESPFQVGDQFAGATVYLNQQITSDEFEAMCDELAKRTDFGYVDGVFMFVNIDYPTVEPEDEAAMIQFYAVRTFLAAGQNSYTTSSSVQKFWELRSGSVDEGDSVILGKKHGNSAPVPVSPATLASFTVVSSMTIDDIGTITVPATITKINFPTLLNAIAGKTANFSKQSIIETSYSFVLQTQNGAYEEAQTEAKLDAKIVNDNIGKIYQYTGTTGNKYKNQSLYIIMED